MLVRSLTIVVLTLIFVGASSAQDAPVPTRVLAISTIPPLEPPPEPDEIINLFLNTIRESVEAGVTGDVVTETWSRLEPAPQQYALDDMAANIQFRTDAYDQELFVGIQVINTTARETPSDLADVSFDAPEMLERFKGLIDALIPHLTDQVRYISIGNEVDVYLSAHDQWAAYERFYAEAADYVRERLPGIQAGVTVTVGGMTQYPEQVAALNAQSDVVILTYYPLEMDFSPRDPETVFNDFAAMMAFAGDKPLILQEVGYPAAASLGSSEADQAEFVRNVFRAWDDAGMRIPFLNFFLMGDFSEEMCANFLVYYGLPGSERFRDFLCTLGLKQVDGTPRQAWFAFVEGGQAFDG